MSTSPRHSARAAQKTAADQQVSEKLNQILQTINTIKTQKETDNKRSQLQTQVEKYDHVLPMIDHEPLRNGGGTPRAYQSNLLDVKGKKHFVPSSSGPAATANNVFNLSSPTRANDKGMMGVKPFESTSLPLSSNYPSYYYGIGSPRTASGSASASRSPHAPATPKNHGSRKILAEGSVPHPPATTMAAHYQHYHDLQPNHHSGNFNASLLGSSSGKTNADGEVFKMGSPRNGFISKTTFSTAFDHHYAAMTKEMKERGPRRSPRQQMKDDRMDKQLHASLRDIRKDQKPYKTLIEASNQQQKQKDEALEALRNHVVNQLRLVRSEAEVDAKTDPRRDYEYAQGVKVSLPLESDNKSQKPIGIRVFHDDDPSPINGLQYQTSRSAKEGLITRRKFVPIQDNITVRLRKRTNQIEDSSIFAEKNGYLRAGLASIETKGSSPRGVH